MRLVKGKQNMDQYSQDDNPFKGSFGTLENLVDRISEVFHCPATIEDANHRLLAYSKHSEETDHARIQTIIGRRVPEKVINSLWKNNILPKINNSDEPIRVHNIHEVGLGDRIAIAIRKNKEVLGYIWALEVDYKFTESDFILFKKAAQVAKSQLLQLQGRQKREQEGVQEFFWQLLTGNIHTQREVKKKFEGFHLSPPAKLSVVVFKFQEEITAPMKQQITYLLSITQQLRSIFHVIDHDELILLSSPYSKELTDKQIHLFIEKFVQHMDRNFHIHHILSGFGTIQEDYTKIEQSYQEALTVIHYKQKFPNEVKEIASYQQLGIFRYLDMILEKNQSENYRNRSLTKIQEYDRLHQTQLVKTLETYLNLDSNVNETAKQLHIHINTLSYRLKRIAEVGEVDLRNANQKMTLFIDLKLDKLEEKEPL